MGFMTPVIKSILFSLYFGLFCLLDAIIYEIYFFSKKIAMLTVSFNM